MIGHQDGTMVTQPQPGHNGFEISMDELMVGAGSHKIPLDLVHSHLGKHGECMCMLQEWHSIRRGW
jgi:hypothetical protein